MSKVTPTADIKDKPTYVCYICNKFLTNKSNLMDHLELVHNERQVNELDHESTILDNKSEILAMENQTNNKDESGKHVQEDELIVLENNESKDNLLDEKPIKLNGVEYQYDIKNLYQKLWVH